MNKPVFKYANLLYWIAAIMAIPLLIDFCTACHLFPLWLAWILLFAIVAVSCVRLWFGFSQKCYKFAWGLIGQILLGVGILIFFQLSYNNVIETPVSHPVTPAVVDIAPPQIKIDSVPAKPHKKSEEKTAKEKSE